MINEQQTRKEIIDRKLSLAGWNVDDLTQVAEEFEITISQGNIVAELLPVYKTRQFSDYVLLGKNGKPIAVIEAKKTSLDANLGREQAKQYCYNIQKQMGGELPFCFYTNGHEIYFWDLENYPPLRITGFPTRDDLERYQYLRKARKKLADELINTKIVGRDYQIQAIRAVLEAIENQKRKFLLVMATGTGKTRTCIALIDALCRGGWAERILFLVDRIALRDQTLDAFKEYLPNEPRWLKVGEKAINQNRRIYVSTYPTMLNVIRDEKNSLSPHFFDLIVVDESHRSIYNTYQEILQYFHTITLGLTATPTDVIDHNTFQLFDCEDQLPTFAFSYEEAIKHIPPYLCDFQVMKIQTRFQEEGINKRTITLDDQKRLIQEGKEIAEINYEGSDLEKKVINRGTNTLIVREFMEESIKDVNGVLPGKTIFFCLSKAHARRIEEIFDALYPQYKGELAKVIVSDDSRVYGKGGLLDQFTNQDMPRIAISVDMLDTGIDVREITNLVFAKPVFSYTKFWQMIGRGTRLLESHKLKPWCTEKDSFLILDCWDNFEYFKLNPLGKTSNTQIPLPVRLFGIRLEKIEEAQNQGKTDIVEREITKLRQQITDLPANSIVIQEASAELAKLADTNFWDYLAPEKIQWLRNTIQPLLRTVAQVDFKAMRFEKDVLETSLAQLRQEKARFETLKAGIIEEISELPLSVNWVAEEEDLIRKSQTPAYWATMNELKYEDLINKLSPLMRFRAFVNPALGQVKFDLKDFVSSKEWVSFGPQYESVSISRYKEMVEAKIKELTEHLLPLQKLKAGQSLSKTEIEELTEALHEAHPHITLDLLRRVYHHRKADLSQFIKHILGLEILESFGETVSKAFADFIKNHSQLTTRQLQFLDLLKNYLLEKGNLQKKDLIQSPFTMLHPEGIRGVFKPQEIEEIMQISQKLVA